MSLRPISTAETRSAAIFVEESACRDVWDQAAAKNPSIIPFAAPAFQNGLARIVRWKRIVIQQPGAGTASVFIRRRGPIQDLVLPPFCPYSAVLPSTDESSVQPVRFFEKMEGLPANRLFSFPPPVGEDSFAGMANQGLEIIPRFTFHLPTAPLEAALAGWSSSQRRLFRNSSHEYQFAVFDGTPERLGQSDRLGQFDRLDQSDRLGRPDQLDNPGGRDIPDLIESLVSLTEAGYRRHGRPLPLPADGLRTWAEELLRAGLGRLYTLHDITSDKLMAGVLALHHAPMAWYWRAGSHPGPAMTVLMAHMQDDLARAGIPALDLMGANTPGIAEFKRRFGGHKVRYLHVRSSTTSGRIADRVAHAIRRVLP